MLSLATHEPYFRIIREEIFVQDRDNTCRRCGEEGHYAAQCSSTLITKTKRKPFIFIDITILREYLKVDLEVPRLSRQQHNLERAIDDWVFLIFLVGNDFLPHLPSLKIDEGAIGILMSIWKTALPNMGGYITENGRLDLARTQIILQRLAEREPLIFRKRHEGVHVTLPLFFFTPIIPPIIFLQIHMFGRLTYLRSCSRSPPT
jgi:5'-3' exoribonuclease 2